MEKAVTEGESPVSETIKTLWIYLPSTMGHVKSRRNLGRPRSKAKYSNWTDSEQYREGKLKRTPVRGVK